MSKLKNKIGDLSSQLIAIALSSGLTWDESVTAFGLATKALAVKACVEGDGSKESCINHAEKRLQQGFSQEVDVSGNFLH